MKIAIAGAGMTGAYLHRVLRNKGHDVDIFDRPHRTKCGISPCAWGTSKEFTTMVEAVGLNFEDYILSQFDYVMIDEAKVSAELLTFDKPRLLKDFLRGVSVCYDPLKMNSYERVIDATGVSRVYLPRVQEDIILRCAQYRLRMIEPLPNRVRLGGIGYAWCFPLGDKEYHIGCGSLFDEPREILEHLGWLERKSIEAEGRVICKCEGDLRIAAPGYSRPFLWDNREGSIWGVGEAIGCVAPIPGDGIVPGVKSVRILLNNWDDPEGYTKAILKEFSWMDKERQVINKLIGMRPLGFLDAWTMKRNAKRMGMQIGLKEAAVLMKSLGKFTAP